MEVFNKNLEMPTGALEVSINSIEIEAPTYVLEVPTNSMEVSTSALTNDVSPSKNPDAQNTPPNSPNFENDTGPIIINHPAFKCKSTEVDNLAIKFFCDICFKPFVHEYNAKGHVYTHMNWNELEETTIFHEDCEFCGKTFLNGRSYMKHVKTHPPPPPLEQDENDEIIAESSQETDTTEYIQFENDSQSDEESETVSITKTSEEGKDPQKLPNEQTGNNDTNGYSFGEITASPPAAVIETSNYIIIPQKLHSDQIAHVETDSQEPEMSNNEEISTLPQNPKEICQNSQEKFETVPSNDEFTIKGPILPQSPPQDFFKVCYFCGKTFKLAWSLQRHLLTHTKETRFKCAICSQQFSDNGRRNLHEKACRGNIPCSFCPSRFKHEMMKTSHERRIHLNLKNGCYFCAKDFKCFSDLQKHYPTHTTETPFKCSLCSQQFADNGNKRRHEKSCEEGNIAKIFRCSFCPLRFTLKSIRTKHQMKIHLKVNENMKTRLLSKVCYFCGKSFKSAWRLQRHFVTHTKETPFKCSLCSQQFMDYSSSKKHEKTCKGNTAKIFRCTFCSSRFTNKTTKGKHEKKHVHKKCSKNIIIKPPMELLRGVENYEIDAQVQAKCPITLAVEPSAFWPESTRGQFQELSLRRNEQFEIEQKENLNEQEMSPRYLDITPTENSPTVPTEESSTDITVLPPPPLERQKFNNYKEILKKSLLTKRKLKIQCKYPETEYPCPHAGCGKKFTKIWMLKRHGYFCSMRITQKSNRILKENNYFRENEDLKSKNVPTDPSPLGKSKTQSRISIPKQSGMGRTNAQELQLTSKRHPQNNNLTIRKSGRIIHEKIPHLNKDFNDNEGASNQNNNPTDPSSPLFNDVISAQEFSSENFGTSEEPKQDNKKHSKSFSNQRKRSVRRKIQRISNSRIKNQKSVCYFCGKFFCNLDIHLLTHTKEMPFKCSRCGKEFNQKGCLTHHERTHPQDRNPSRRSCRSPGQKNSNPHFYNDWRNIEFIPIKDPPQPPPKQPETVIEISLPSLKRKRLVSEQSENEVAIVPQLEEITIVTQDLSKQSEPIIVVQKAKQSEQSEIDFTIESQFEEIANNSIIAHELASQPENSRIIIQKRIFMHHNKTTEKISTISTQQQKFTCYFCKKFVQNLDLHLRIAHTKETPFKCQICKKGFIQKVNLSIHEETHGVNGRRNFPCRFCTSRFVHQKTRFQHEKIHLMERSASKTSIVTQSKSENDEINTKKSTQFQRNTKRKLPFCYFFSKKSENIEHLSSHTKEASFKCRICRKVFLKKEMLSMHEETHGVNGNRKFLCRFCPERFIQQATRFQHEMIHLKNKDFKGHWGNCGWEDDSTLLGSNY